MYTSISGVYENGKLTLLENPPSQKKARVIVTFIEEEEKKTPKRKLGGLEGKITLPDDFNEPLDDLKDYMY